MLRVPVCRSVRRMLAENAVPPAIYRRTYRRAWLAHVATDRLCGDLAVRLAVRVLLCLALVAVVPAALGHSLALVEGLVATLLVVLASLWTWPIDSHLVWVVARKTRIQLGLPAEFFTLADIKRVVFKNITHHKP